MLFRQHRPDLTLMDLRLPDISGIDATIAIRTEHPGARIVILSTFEGDAECRRALLAGVHSYVLKSMPPGELLNVIRQVHAGKKRIPPQMAAQLAEYLAEDSLSQREIEVLKRVAEGNRNKDIDGNRLRAITRAELLHDVFDMRLTCQTSPKAKRVEGLRWRCNLSS